MPSILDPTAFRRLELPPLVLDGEGGRPMPNPSRQARRRAARLRAKGRAPVPHDLTPLGVLLAAELPVHETGNWRLRDGWVSPLDAICWHEAAHAVVALHFGMTVKALTVADPNALRAGDCDFHAEWGRGEDGGAHGYRCLATAALAGHTS